MWKSFIEGFGKSIGIFTGVAVSIYVIDKLTNGKGISINNIPEEDKKH